MTVYDVAMVCMVVAGVAWGFWRGITWQLASIASLILGYSASRTLSTQVADQFPGEPVVARALAMIVIYAAVSGGVFLVAWIVRATLRKMQFEAFDRHLGMMLGAVEGTLLGLIVTLFVVSLAPSTRQPIFSSPTGHVVGLLMETLGPVLPAEARRVLAPFWHEGEEAPADQQLADDSSPAPSSTTKVEPTPTTTSTADSDAPADPRRPRKGLFGLRRGEGRSRTPEQTTQAELPAPASSSDLFRDAPAELSRSLDQNVQAAKEQARGAINSQVNDLRRTGTELGSQLNSQKADLTRSVNQGAQDLQGIRDRTRGAVNDGLNELSRSKSEVGGLIEQQKAKLSQGITNEVNSLRNQAIDAAKAKLNETVQSKSMIGDLIEGEKSKFTRAVVDEVKGVGNQVRDAARSRLNAVDSATPSLGELFDKGEEKLGRAISEKVEQELRKVGTSTNNAGPAQRR